MASNLTPLSKRGMASLRGRNNSVQIHHATHTPGIISPGYASIVTSARREAKGLNFEIGAPLSNTIATSSKPSSIFSPSRKRGSAALLYGRNQQLSRVKLQIEERIQQAEFMDKVHVQNNAVNLIRKAARVGVSNLEGSAQNAASTFGDRSFGAVSQMNT